MVALTGGEMALASGTVASALTVIAQDTINDGFSPTTWTASGIVSAGVAVFLFMDRRAQKDRTDVDAQRRAADEKIQDRITALEAAIQAKDEEIRRLHERIIEILTQGRNQDGNRK